MSLPSDSQDIILTDVSLGDIKIFFFLFIDGIYLTNRKRGNYFCWAKSISQWISSESDRRWDMTLQICCCSKSIPGVWKHCFFPFFKNLLICATLAVIFRFFLPFSFCFTNSTVYSPTLHWDASECLPLFLPNEALFSSPTSNEDGKEQLAYESGEDEDDEEEEEEDFKPSDGSENEMETEILDYVWTRWVVLLLLDRIFLALVPWVLRAQQPYTGCGKPELALSCQLPTCTDCGTCWWLSFWMFGRHCPHFHNCWIISPQNIDRGYRFLAGLQMAFNVASQQAAKRDQSPNKNTSWQCIVPFCRM